jgi:hypothetical protein
VVITLSKKALIKEGNMEDDMIKEDALLLTEW